MMFSVENTAPDVIIHARLRGREPSGLCRPGGECAPFLNLSLHVPVARLLSCIQTGVLGTGAVETRVLVQVNNLKFQRGKK